MFEGIMQGIIIAGGVGGIGVVLENYFWLRPTVKRVVEENRMLRVLHQDMKNTNIVEFEKYNQQHRETNSKIDEAKRELRAEFSGEIKEINEKVDRIEEKVDNGFTGLQAQMTNLVSAILGMKT
jgi:uncharacterized radical SAM superfamily Fe-S cluster-containing enzyme